MPWAPEVVTELDQMLEEMYAMGFEVILDPKQQRLTEQELIERWQGIYAHVCGADAMTGRAIRSADQLRIISRIGVGVDSIDLRAAAEKGVAVATTPGVGAETVAEFAFAMMLALSRRVCQIDRDVRAGRWHKLAGYSLYRKTLGIVGFGNIGQQLARLTKGFDMRILAYDPYMNEAYARENGIICASLEKILEMADYISLHVPLNEQTRHLIDAKAFAHMKSSCQLINCARGEVVDSYALYDALHSGRIAGAALDVWEKEPADLTDPLFTLNNVLVSAHNAGTSIEGKNKVVRAALQNVVSYSRGESFKGLLHLEAKK